MLDMLSGNLMFVVGPSEVFAPPTTAFHIIIMSFATAIRCIQSTPSHLKEANEQTRLN